MENLHRLVVNMDYSDTLNYAMVLNGIPFIRKITLKNDSEMEMKNLKLSIVFPEGMAEDLTRAFDLLPAGIEVDLGRIPVEISPDYLFNLTEAISVQMKVILEADSMDTLVLLKDISVLSYNEWQGMDSMPEVLSAFVTPNHPSVDSIIIEASHILKESGKDPSFEGYQKGDINRVREQVHALYTALKNQMITYIGPPASFVEGGQRIRLSSEVLEKKMGTCLDLTLLFASCLEAVSLHPLVILIKGHSFLGFWQEEEFFQDTVEYDLSSLTKRTAEGMNIIGLLETTDIRIGVDTSFSDSERNAAAHFSHEEDFVMAIDIRRARVGGIRPLPERLLVNGNYVRKTEKGLEERIEQLPELKEIMKTVPENEENKGDRKTHWERKLLDLSLRNNLLNYVPGRKGIQLLVRNSRELEDGIYDGREYLILPEITDHHKEQAEVNLSPSDYLLKYDDLIEGEFEQKKLRTLLDEENLAKKLTKMYRDARLHIEESGANSLFLAVGLLKWYENTRTTKERYAPLLLIPVELKKKVGRNAYSISGRDEDTLVNVTLFEKLKQDFGIEVKGLSEVPVDEKGVDVVKVMSIVRNAVLGQKRWDVSDDVHLGIFSFSRFIMWNDIRNHGEELKRNKVIASLMDGRLSFDAEQIVVNDVSLDETIAPDEILLPVSTDSSQLQAVNAAVKGQSFVLHGPPGTGKSQTITTIIANALYQGKRVLFVAEKMAALSVVQRRLEGLGLGHFSLEVHSNKSRKTQVLKKLEETTKLVSSGKPDFTGEAERLKTLRNELNDIVKSLYRTYNSGFSAYDLMGRLESLSHAREIEDLELDYEKLTKEDMEKLFLMGRELGSISAVMGEYADAPLKGLGITEYTFDLKSQVEKEITGVKEKAGILAEMLSSAADRVNIQAPEEKDQVDNLYMILKRVMTGDFPRNLLLDDEEGKIVELKDITALMARKNEVENKLLHSFEPALFLLDENALRDQFLQAEEKFFLLRRMAKKKVLRILSLHKKGSEVTEEDVIPLLTDLSAKKELERKIEEEMRKSPDLKRVIEGRAQDQHESTLTMLIKEKEHMKALFAAFSEADRVILKQHLNDKGADDFRAFMKAYEAFSPQYDALKDRLNLNVDSLPELEGNWAYRLQDRLSTYLNNLDDLREWISYNRLTTRAKENHLEPMIRAFESSDLSGKNAEDAIRKSIYKGAFLYILQHEKALEEVTGRAYQDKIAYFREVTARYEELAKLEIQNRLASRIPDMMKEANGSSEVGILQRAIRSGGRGMTLRTLFDRLPNLLPRITPCMLMSPLSVAQYLGTSKEYFDLVIFDEASQMPTAESVGAMARGREVVIVGDPKQLPPTTFFSTSGKNEEEEDGIAEDLDNILEDALALSMPETSLLWHYRSRHESLIAYSNRTYYENSLYTYPSPQELKSKVSYEYVEATYGRGGTRSNKKEAEAVVHEIMERLKDEKRMNDSIGVVTFSMAQKDMIEDTLQEALIAYPEIEEKIMKMEEPVFVKNLENVQGDERDVILFSIGYGPDEEGKITLNFGPLNRENGWKRLNVAITRSKKEMKIFTSIKPEHMDTSKTSSQGIHDLKGFLEYARRGSLPVDLEEVRSMTDKNTLSDAIRKELEASGLKADTRVGASKYKVDLAVVDERNPSEYLLGILCHGESYRNARSARDRDILQESVLKGLGWKILHVYPMDWMENREKEMDRILGKVRSLLSGNPGEEKTLPEPGLKIGNLVSKSDPELHSETAEKGLARIYEEAKFRVKSLSSEEFRMPKHTRDIKDALVRIIQEESPISLDLLYRQTLKAFGTRATAKSIERIDNILSDMGYPITDEDGKFFIYGDEPEPAVTFYRYPSKECKREGSDIPFSEIRLAIKDVVMRQVSLPKDMLASEVQKIFGYARGNEELSRRIESVLGQGKIEGIIKDETGNYTAV